VAEFWATTLRVRYNDLSVKVAVNLFWEWNQNFKPVREQNYFCNVKDYGAYLPFFFKN